MKKKYNPRNIEFSLYKDWEKKGYFKPSYNASKESFCIMIPPPNITGNLHMGHAFQQTIIDIMIRYQRMQGKDTLLQLGTDHAGIVTQIVVERKIAFEENKTRYDYGREAFIKKIWQWKKVSDEAIMSQIRRLGNSVDWDCQRFTMDKDFSNVVKEVFIRLYNENLIYRGKRLVNWDPKISTAISDLEVENRESKSFIWYIRYPLADGVKTIDGKNYLVVATTRPETLLGDTGVAVNPEDPNYQNLIGKFIILPIISRRIPIIGDKYANIKKGTGCVKITPAHDFNDYEVGYRHQLPMINILTFDGKIRENAEVFDYTGKKSNIYSSNIPDKFQKLERFCARELIINIIKTIGLIEKISSHNLIIPYSDRSGVIIEPMLTDQWYVRANILAKPAIKAVKNGDIQFIQEKYKNTYFSWMRDIKDWCISRQIWWGHRIPAWYDKKGNIFVGRNEEEVRQKNNFSSDVILYQDNDVLDTWFSSSLWTFATLGWPNKTKAMRQFHPTSVIVSGFDIIFFWIARMIMMTMHFIKDSNGHPKVPFKTVYITGLIHDENGQKMSKSKGNVIDPIDLIDGISLTNLLKKRTSNMVQPQLEDEIRKRTKKQFPNGIKAYGTDSLRFTLTTLASNNRNISWDIKHLESYHNFCNKLWNASYFVFMHTENEDCGFNEKEKVISLTDRWILSEFNETVKFYREALNSFRFDIAARILYKFIRNQFCDWYIEVTKSILNNDGSKKELRGVRNTLITVLEALLRLAHPIIPFITETIWQNIKIIAGINAQTIMLQPFPEFNITLVDKIASANFEWVKKIIVTIRNFRSEMKIIPKKPLKLIIRSCSEKTIIRIKNNEKILKNMAYLEKISVLPVGNTGPISLIKIIDDTELLFPIEGLIDKVTELKRLSKELVKIEDEINQIENKLANKSFISHAPKALIIKERKKLVKYIDIRTKLIEQKTVITTI